MLYHTTVKHDCFPGKVPFISKRPSATADILAALGLGAVDSRYSHSTKFTECSSHGNVAVSMGSGMDPTLHQTKLAQHDPQMLDWTLATSFDIMDTQKDNINIHQEEWPSFYQSTPSQHRHYSCSSQATTLNDFSGEPEPYGMADMQTQFAIAVGDSDPTYLDSPIPQDPPSGLQAAPTDDDFFDFERYNQESILALIHAQQMQQDPMLQYVPELTTASIF